MRSIFLLSAVLALTVYGQLAIKARALGYAAEAARSQGKLNYLFSMVTDLWVLSGFAAAALAGACWLLAIQRLELGYAYPFMALSFVFVPVGSLVLFGEPLPATQMVGLALIVVGATVSALAR
jgi:drug/metabolite transporter (DMT)-like permease